MALPGKSRRIRVEPLRQPTVPEPQKAPAPPVKEPKKEPAKV